MNPEFIDQWFSIEQQRTYISMLIGRVGLTRRRAECFVRLWVYLLIKHQQEAGTRLKPLTKLPIPSGFIACTHREAASIFYCGQDKGSDRSAGMMIDKLLALGLLEKQFDGNCLYQIRALPDLVEPQPPKARAKVIVDDFNPRTDAVPVASFLARNYNWMSNNTAAIPHKISKLLRQWAEQYPVGMRVLRCSETHHPVGFYLLYPTLSECEVNFFLPPSKSLHLSSASEIDPLQMAIPGSPSCPKDSVTSLLVRSWMIDTAYKNWENVRIFLKDVQTTLVRIQEDFPNLCDFYTLVIHPQYEKLAMSLGFQKIGTDPQSSLYWMYTAVEQYLNLDIAEVVTKLEFGCPTPEF